MTRIDDARMLDHVLGKAVASGVLPGVVALVATAEDILYEACLGVRDVVSGAPMTPDTVFGIASMTKSVTAAAVLQLAERGVVTLSQPVGEILPAFDALPVLTGFDGDAPMLREQIRRATIRDLLANTSGLGYDTWDKDLWHYHALTGIPNISGGSRETFRVPLIAQPGERFSYGTGSDWAGLIIEQVTGQPLDVYFRENITGPLGMLDTDVELTASQRSRSAAIHLRAAAGDWTVQPASPETAAPEFYAGGHCLYSTPVDYLLFQRALLAGGALGRARVLSAGSVGSMFTDQTGGLALQAAATRNPALCLDLRFPPGARWGLGFMLTGTRDGGMRPTGSAGWAGVFNTLYWIDPVNGITAALCTQTLPFRDSSIMQAYADFEQCLYQQLPHPV